MNEKMDVPKQSLPNKPLLTEIVTVIICALLTLGIFRWAYQESLNGLTSRFNRVVDLRLELIKNVINDSQILAHNLSIVAGTTGIDGNTFSMITGPIIKDLTEIQAVQWVQKVSRSERARFERETNLIIYERDQNKQKIIAQDRDYHFPVTFLEPLISENRPVLGFDMNSTPDRVATIAKAVDSGKTTATPPIKLIQHDKKINSAGFLTLTPIYIGGEPPLTIEERRAKHSGFIVVVVSAERMLKRALGKSEPLGIDIDFLDVSIPAESQLLYHWETRISPSEPFLNLIYHTPASKLLTFENAGRTIGFKFTPNQSFIKQNQSLGHWLIIPIGFVMTALLVIFIRGTRQREETLEHRVADRTKLLNEYAQRLELATSSANLGIWDLNVKENVMIWDDQMMTLYGYKKEDFPGGIEAWKMRLHPEDHDAMWKLCQAALQGECEWKFEFRIKLPDGELRWIKAVGDVIRDSGGTPVRMIGIGMNITERKQMVEALANSNRFNQQIIDSAQEGIIVYGPDLRYLVWNQFMEKLSGYKASEVLGRQPLDVFPFLKDVGVYERLERTLRGEIMEEIEFPFSSRGKSGWNVDSCVPMRNEHGAILGVIGIVRDTTAHHNTEEQLRQSQKMEAVGQLAGGVAHDFNNILTVIAGYCSLLQADDSLNDKQKMRISEIATSAEKAAQLTNGLLAFSRKQPLIMKQENLNDIVKHVHKFLARIIGEDIVLELTCRGSELAIVADRGQIEQVLINLAANARDAMPNGGVFRITSEYSALDSTSANIHNYHVSPGKYALLTVSDTGTGISKENLGHIFEPFFTTKEVGKGTGLGMAIIYGIIKQHNGFINVYSEPGMGTTFRIYLPIQETGDKPLLIDKTEIVSPVVGCSETILVAEDEYTVRTLVAQVLSDYGYEVVLAENGQDAIEKFKLNQDRISLILMDMIMPKMNGMEAFREVQCIKPGIKVLFSSGYTADFIEGRGVSGNEIKLIMKPILPTDLLRKIREALDTA